MIGFLRGEVLEVGAENLIVDVQGVGYEVTASTETLNQVQPGQPVRLWIHTHVREDALQLFGFSGVLEREVFLSLLKVNGVGPKMAIKILSGAPTEHIVNLIEQGDAKGLSSLPKVGKKTAEQIILTLKGKLASATQRDLGGARGEVVSALVNLGFRLADVERVVKDLPAETEVEEGVRRGLQALSTL